MTTATLGLPALVVLGCRCWWGGLATLLTGNSGRGLPGRLGGSSSNMESVGAPGDKHTHTTVSKHDDTCNILTCTIFMKLHPATFKPNTWKTREIQNVRP
jgi:hypothetical protein